MSDAVVIRELDATEAARRIADFAALLMDCVAGGASVSFMAGLTLAEARAFWTKTAGGVAAGEVWLFGAFAGDDLVGSVQLHPADKPNQPHRGDLAKMLVRRDARRRGLGAALLTAAEDAARARGRWLLVLDTEEAGAGERLYARGGWARVGKVPNYALTTDGRLAATVVFCKDLRDARGAA
jgi:GNAT superfamily N-acetyltransferase